MVGPIREDSAFRAWPQGIPQNAGILPRFLRKKTIPGKFGKSACKLEGQSSVGAFHPGNWGDQGKRGNQA